MPVFIPSLSLSVVISFICILKEKLRKQILILMANVQSQRKILK